MQGDKKQGAGSKGTWGKIGDEYVKDVPHSESDEEETEAMQAKFTEEVKQKLAADKLTSDELEPAHAVTGGESQYTQLKVLATLRKPELEEYAKNKEKLSVESRAYIEAAYNASNDAVLQHRNESRSIELCGKAEEPGKNSGGQANGSDRAGTR